MTSETTIPQAVAVIGAGTMGAGIAQVAAARGTAVCLVDTSPELVEQGLANIRHFLERSVEKGKLTPAARDEILGRLRCGTSIESLRDDPSIGLAVEVVVEDLSVKRDVFAALEAALSDDAVLATNTSSLSISEIAAGSKHAQRIVGMHFFNPAPLMPLVEIVSGKQTAAAAADRAFRIAQAWGKTPVRVKDTPGFIVNRVARGFYLEALRLLDEGVAGVDEIDQVMRVHGRFRMGPFELMDLIGIDVNYAVSTSVWEQMDRPARLMPHLIQQKLVDQGNIGRKSGRGFYDHSGRSPLPALHVDRKSFELAPLLKDVMRTFCARAGATDAGATEQYVFCRILAAIINEAGIALCDEVATKEDIDTAMKLGTNYPKGPLEWAEQIGHRTIRGTLRALNEQSPEKRYEPAALFARTE